MRPSRLALLVVLALLAVGCAEDPLPEPAPQPAAQAPTVPLTLETPSIEPVPASAGNGQLRARTEVTGRAAAGTLVQVSAQCDEDDCSTGAQADVTGRWSARLLIAGDGVRRAKVRLVAQSGAHVAIGLARLQARIPKSSKRTTSKQRKRRTSPRATRSTATTRTTTAAPTAPAAAAATAPGASSYSSSPSGPASRLVMVGDSLAVGTQAPLAGALPGWTVTTDGRTSRPLADGMRVVRGLGETPPVLAVSLFTNDGPGSVAALESAVRETIAMQRGHGCVIWATIVRPAVGGQTYDKANAALGRLAAADPSVMRLVPWAQQVASNPSWLASDGVHATPAGYAARAQLYAAAARSCVA